MTMMIKPLNVLGLMAGTSLDGIKASLILTDGVDLNLVKYARKFLFPDNLRQQIRGILGKKDSVAAEKTAIDNVEKEFTLFLLQIILEIKNECGEQIELVGLEGPTICHEPENNFTYQLGKGKILAQKSRFKVVTHFHNADILNGGQGSPITASYYDALARNIDKPAVFINVGGISSINWIGHYGEISAFDCGPGNALIDDWMLKHGGILMDYNGKCAALGTVHEKIVSNMLKHNFFAKYPPKSIDRNDFNDKVEHLEGLSLEDGAATATAFVAEAIAYSLALYLPELPVQAILCGGGAANPTLVRFIRQRLKNMDIETVLPEDIDLKISNAQAIAFLAARRLYSLPITFPGTTGVQAPMPGGEIYEPENIGF